MMESDPAQPDNADSAYNTSDGRKRRIMLMGVLPALFLPLFGTLIYTTLPRESGFVGFAYGITKLIALIWVPVFVLLERWRPAPKTFNWNLYIKAIPLGILTGCAIGALFWACFLWTPLGDAVRAQNDNIHDFASRLGALGHYILFAVAFSLAHSLWEEIYWRWYVFGRLILLIRKTWPAYVIASIAFASHHFIVLKSFLGLGHAVLFTFGVALGGALWCRMLDRQGTIVGAWISHAIVDASFFAIGYVAMGL